MQSQLKLMNVTKIDEIPIVCIHCHEEICTLPTDQWPPKYHGKRIFKTERKWNQRLFHTIFDHYSKKLVAVHYACKLNYYRSTFSGGRDLKLVAPDHKCLTCEAPFDRNQFYVNKNSILIHRNCNPKQCFWCKKALGVSKYIYLGPYVLHLTCSEGFCVKTPRRQYDINGKQITHLLDVDKWWPDRLTKNNLQDFPPEFRITVRQLLWIVKHFQLPYRIPIDVILMIINFAISPIDYPIQHGFKLDFISLVQGGLCHKCKYPGALTRHDKGYCTLNECLTYTNQRCQCGHCVKKIISSPRDCTKYRCGYQNRCKRCDGFIRYDENTPKEWCKVDYCNYRWRGSCVCGRPVFKTSDLEDRPIQLNDDQCTMNNCRYLVSGTTCKCGKILFKASPLPYACTLQACGTETKEMVEDTMRAIHQNRAKGAYAMISFGNTFGNK